MGFTHVKEWLGWGDGQLRGVHRDAATPARGARGVRPAGPRRQLGARVREAAKKAHRRYVVVAV